MGRARLGLLAVLPALLTTACASSTVISSSTSTGTADTGVEGTVSAAPSCPVQQFADPCPPRPVEASLRVLDGAGKVTASGRSDTMGRYRLAAAPGRYEVVASSPSPGLGCQATWVVVTATRWARANVSCDTGIR
jgi:hypothetical protein